jgi:ribosome modulation factor
LGEKVTEKFCEGYMAALDGKLEENNPYKEETDRSEWQSGWTTYQIHHQRLTKFLKELAGMKQR